MMLCLDSTVLPRYCRFIHGRFVTALSSQTLSDLRKVEKGNNGFESYPELDSCRDRKQGQHNGVCGCLCMR